MQWSYTARASPMGKVNVMKMNEITIPHAVFMKEKRTCHVCKKMIGVSEMDLTCSKYTCKKCSKAN